MLKNLTPLMGMLLVFVPCFHLVFAKPEFGISTSMTISYTIRRDSAKYFYFNNIIKMFLYTIELNLSF